MTVIIQDGDVSLMQRLAPRSVELLVFITSDRLTPARSKKLAEIAAPTLAPGGAAYIAQSLEEVWERI